MAKVISYPVQEFRLILSLDEAYDLTEFISDNGLADAPEGIQKIWQVLSGEIVNATTRHLDGE